MITRAWQEQKEIKEVMLFLQSHSVSTNFAVKIYKTYGDEVIAIVKENPYQLAEDIFGIGFKTADTVASNLGVERDSRNRLMSGIQYFLSQSADEGHVYLPQDELIRKSAEMLDVDARHIIGALAELQERESVVVEDDNVYLAPFYYAETGVANKMALLLKTAAPRPVPHIDGFISRLEKAKRITFAGKQKEAIRKAFSSKVMILTGGPGTGKTTTLIGIIELMEQLGQ